MAAKEKDAGTLGAERVNPAHPVCGGASRALRENATRGTVGRMADATENERVPEPTSEELQIARENLDAYLELAWEIYEELQGKRDGLTPEEPSSTIQGKVD